ncbi:unnamed protein product [Urochloa decumbens]|uniref:Cysteine-rich receptor-like protein kinase 10 n=1 Tax=Urochloa decumbens TaxID=240449 RepID=A0ABC9D591_9POAL
MGRHLLAVAAAVALLAPFAAGYPWPMCGTMNTFAANSTYQANLNRLAATLPGNASASPNLYATAVAGAVPEQVWAMALCRGDADATACGSCLAQAFRDVQSDCPYSKDATIYYDPCTLHYSDVHTLAGDDDTGPTTDEYGVTNDGNVTSDPPRFNALLAALLNATADYAAFNSTRRFATGQADFLDKNFLKMYSLAQCPPDQPPARCRKCLAGIIADGLPRSLNSIGGRVLWVNCTYRFETAPFYSGPAMVRLPSPGAGAPVPGPAVETLPEAGEGRRNYNVPGIVLAVVLAVLAATNLVACLCFWRRRRRQRPTAEAKKSYPMYSTEAEDVEMVDSMMMDVSTLRTATGDFDESNKLGEGGFGAVYKGVLPDGDEVAVKRLSDSSTQGEDELKNELTLVAKLKHKNLVRLVGVCLEQQERLLVYEYVPNRSLDLMLFDTENENHEQLDWRQRYRIINGIARGLQYLHEDSQLKVVHRDLKASNILLDANMNPKISDFGLARIFDRDQTQAKTSQIVGTYGYMAPEYVMRGNYSVKSDAFSFGVIVLEIVTGRKNNGSYSSKPSGDLLNTVWEHWEAGTVMELVDPSMNGSFPEGDVLRCFHIGLLCVQGDPAARPVMSSVVMMLGTDTISLQAPSKPGFFATDNSQNTEVTTTAAVQD